jgi:hypothetical protein
MIGTVIFNGNKSDKFPICSGVKQGCVLAPTLFGIFFAVMLNYTFGSTTDGVLLSTRSDGNLFNLSRLKAKSQVHLKCLRDFLFADHAALVSNTESGLQLLVEKYNNACNEFGLTISLKKT